MKMPQYDPVFADRLRRGAVSGSEFQSRMRREGHGAAVFLGDRKPDEATLNAEYFGGILGPVQPRGWRYWVHGIMVLT